MSSLDVMAGQGTLVMAGAFVPNLQVQILRPVQQLKSYSFVGQPGLAVFDDQPIDVGTQIVTERPGSSFSRNRRARSLHAETINVA